VLAAPGAAGQDAAASVAAGRVARRPSRALCGENVQTAMAAPRDQCNSGL
jgi:hypothetical protein